MLQELRDELDDLLGEDPRAVQRRETSMFDDSADPFSDRIVLFGAGGLGRKALRGLRQAGVEPIAFSDNNPGLWNRAIDGVSVLSPSDAAGRFGARAVFVVTVWTSLGGSEFETFKRQLTALGCCKVLSWCPLFWKYSDLLLPEYAVGAPTHVRAAAPEIRRAIHALNDAQSQWEFVAQLRWRLRGEFGAVSTSYSQNLRLPNDRLLPGDDDFFVDCGAFDGDTIRTFLERSGHSFRHIVAFEPDPNAFARLEHYTGTLPQDIRGRIEPLRVAVGGQHGTIRFGATGTPASAATTVGGEEVRCERLDDILTDVAPTYIKMDIEGAELEALEGARSIITRHRPGLAVCAYHRPDHFWEVPLAIQSLSPEYNLFLSPTREGFWHLVCYAATAERLDRDWEGVV